MDVRRIEQTADKQTDIHCERSLNNSDETLKLLKIGESPTERFRQHTAADAEGEKGWQYQRKRDKLPAHQLAFRPFIPVVNNVIHNRYGVSGERRHQDTDG